MKYRIVLAMVSILAMSMAGAADEALPGGRHVAGSTPNQRPTGAPVIKESPTGTERRKAALVGISEPVPPSLKFLDNQGAWYTPFDQPGMPGYYDLRGMHAVPTASKR